jgi:hypothetical protein
LIHICKNIGLQVAQPLGKFHSSGWLWSGFTRTQIDD